MTVADMMRRMDAREYAAWHIRWCNDPWGERRADLRTGVLASLICAAGGEKDKTPPSPEDFVLFDMSKAGKAKPKKMSNRQLDFMMRAMAAAFPGGKEN